MSFFFNLKKNPRKFEFVRKQFNIICFIPPTQQKVGEGGNKNRLKIIDLKISKNTGKRSVYLCCIYWDHAVPNTTIRHFHAKKIQYVENNHEKKKKVLSVVEEQNGPEVKLLGTFLFTRL